MKKPDNLTRRWLVAAAGRTFAAALLAAPGAEIALAAMTRKLSDMPLPRLDDPADPSFQVFMRLGQWITCREHLDETAPMWDALDGLVEAPGFTTARPGDWAKPPRGAGADRAAIEAGMVNR